MPRRPASRLGIVTTVCAKGTALRNVTNVARHEQQSGRLMASTVRRRKNRTGVCPSWSPPCPTSAKSDPPSDQSDSPPGQTGRQVRRRPSGQSGPPGQTVRRPTSYPSQRTYAHSPHSTCAGRLTGCNQRANPGPVPNARPGPWTKGSCAT